MFSPIIVFIFLFTSEIWQKLRKLVPQKVSDGSDAAAVATDVQLLIVL